MTCCRLSEYRKILGSEFARLEQHGKYATDIDERFTEEVNELIRAQVDADIKSGKPSSDIDGLDELLMRHAIETMVTAFQLADSDLELLREPKKRLAATPKVVLPRSLKELIKLWDKIRKKQYKGSVNKTVQKRVDALADSIRKAYTKKAQSVWDKHGDDYRSGKTGSKERAVKAFERIGDVTQSRAKMVIETETTYYNNKARKTFYDTVPEVTHYLYLAVRDHATTKWCKTRHGKVFEKGTELQKENVPPVHWNCRSEIVPLTPQNPKHRLLIDDPSKRATPSKLEPLPKGWKAR